MSIYLNYSKSHSTVYLSNNKMFLSILHCKEEPQRPSSPLAVPNRRYSLVFVSHMTDSPTFSQVILDGYASVETYMSK